MEYVALILSVVSTIIGIIHISHLNTIDKIMLKFAKKEDTLDSIGFLEKRMEFLEVIPQVRELLVLRGQDPDTYGISYDYKHVILPSGKCHTPQEIRLLLKTTKEACCKKKAKRSF